MTPEERHERHCPHCLRSYRRPEGIFGLSIRATVVLHLLSQGLSNQGIAAAMTVTDGVVDNAINVIYKEMLGEKEDRDPAEHPRLTVAQMYRVAREQHPEIVDSLLAKYEASGQYDSGWPSRNSADPAGLQSARRDG